MSFSFGNSGSSGFSFGGNSGSSSSTGSGFSFGGSSGSSTGSGFSFGGNSGSSNSTGSGFSFGGSSGSSSSSGFSFGGNSSSSSGSSGFSFGSSSSNNNGGSSFSFGGSSSSTPSGGFSFASTNSNTGNNFGTSFASSTYGQDTIISQIKYVQERYNQEPNNANCCFRHVFYDLVNPDEAAKFQEIKRMNYSNAPHLSQLFALAMNQNPEPTRLVPHLAVGYSELKKRVEAQDTTIKKHKEALEAAKKDINRIKKQHQANVWKLAEAKRKHKGLADRLLAIIARLELLQARGNSIFAEEEVFKTKLQNMLFELNKPTQFKGRLNELNSLIRMQQDITQEPQFGTLDESSAENIAEYLEQQTLGLETLTSIIEEDSKYLEIMMKTLQEEAIVQK